MPTRHIHSGYEVGVSDVPPAAAGGQEDAKMVSFTDPLSGDRHDFPLNAPLVAQLHEATKPSESRLKVATEMPPFPPPAAG